MVAALALIHNNTGAHDSEYDSRQAAEDLAATDDPDERIAIFKKIIASLKTGMPSVSDGQVCLEDFYKKRSPDDAKLVCSSCGVQGCNSEELFQTFEMEKNSWIFTSALRIKETEYASILVSIQVPISPSHSIH